MSLGVKAFDIWKVVIVVQLLKIMKFYILTI